MRTRLPKAPKSSLRGRRVSLLFAAVCLAAVGCRDSGGQPWTSIAVPAVTGALAARRAPAPSLRAPRAYLEAHGDRFSEPARYHLRQLPLADAEQAEVLLASLPPDPEAAEGHGIALVLPRHLPSHSERELASLFGPGFAAAVAQQPVGRWSGPVSSPYAVHLVFVEARDPSRRSALRVVRAQLREALLEERAEAALRATLDAWRREAAS